MESLVAPFEDFGSPFLDDLVVLDTIEVAPPDAVQGCPPSLSNQGNLRLPKKKSGLLDCLLGDGTSVQSQLRVQSTRPTVNVTVIDGAVAVNIISANKETTCTFEDYALKSFLPYVEAQVRLVDRISVVWDVYVENSLKQTTRCNRGTGVRRRISVSSPIPRNWSEFLRVDEKKNQLLKFLQASKSSRQSENKLFAMHSEND